MDTVVAFRIVELAVFMWSSKVFAKKRGDAQACPNCSTGPSQRAADSRGRYTDLR